MIEDVFGVSYHPAHVSRFLKEIGWSVQKSSRWATQRDEAVIEQWYAERWPAERRGAKEKYRRIVLV